MEIKTVKEMSKGVHRLLFFLNFALNVIIPIFAVIYICVYGDPEIVTDKNVEALMSSFFLVAIFIFWMQILFASYFPKNLYAALKVIFLPFLIMGLQYFFVNFSPALYIVDMGIVYVISIMLAFSILVMAGPIHSINDWKKDWSEYLFGSFLQLIFIIPGAIAIYVMGKFIFFTQIWSGQFDKITVVYGIIFLAAIADNIYEFYQALKENSIYGGASDKVNTSISTPTNKSRNPEFLVKNYLNTIIKNGESAAEYFVEKNFRNKSYLSPYTYGEIISYSKLKVEEEQNGVAEVSFEIHWKADIGGSLIKEDTWLNTAKLNGVWWIVPHDYNTFT